MPVRAHNLLRADAACVSADVLTPTERHVERAQRRAGRPALAVVAEPAERRSCLRWRDVPAIRDVLALVLRG